MEKENRFSGIPDAAAWQDPAAYEKIMRKFWPIIRSIAGQYFLNGGDNDDLLQEGLIALYKATLSFDAEKNDDFVKYAKICIHRAMINAFENANSRKNAALNTSVEYDETLHSPEISLEQTVLQREQLLRVYERIEDTLSETERKVLSMSMDGKTQRQIGQAIGKTPKAIEGILSRIRSKLN